MTTHPQEARLTAQGTMMAVARAIGESLGQTHFDTKRYLPEARAAIAAYKAHLPAAETPRQESRLMAADKQLIADCRIVFDEPKIHENHMKRIAHALYQRLTAPHSTTEAMETEAERPGFGWRLSDEARKDIEAIEDATQQPLPTLPLGSDTPPQPKAMETRAEPTYEMLRGSNVQPSVIPLPDGTKIQLREVVYFAVKRGNYTPEAWNALESIYREARIASARKWFEDVSSEPSSIMAGNPEGPMGDVVKAELARQLAERPAPPQPKEWPEAWIHAVNVAWWEHRSDSGTYAILDALDKVGALSQQLSREKLAKWLKDTYRHENLRFVGFDFDQDADAILSALASGELAK